ncbi:MAG: ATP-dependent Clp protease proteolytic subunit [Deltaproteobacteria bacterium]|nr:ATP-dependent Clp protease proteolytic subunit [Deltaproteobacteria bacterium]
MDQLRESRLMESRTLILSEAVGARTAKQLVSDLLNLDASSNKPIYLYINSPGGEVNSGFAIYDTVRFINSPVYMITAGLCASIATIINVAVPAERRLAFPNSRFLIHQPLISGQVYGQASDIEITATQILKTREKINHMLADACKQDIIRVEEDTVRDYWMSATESLEYGLIGKIIHSRKELA